MLESNIFCMCLEQAVWIINDDAEILTQYDLHIPSISISAPHAHLL